MLDPVTIAGLTSSMITILDTAYKVGKRTVEISKLAGDLPPDLLAIKDLIDLVSKTCERLKIQISDLDPGTGPITEYGAALQAVFERGADVCLRALGIFDRITGSTSLTLAMRVIKKQGEVQRLRGQLDEINLSIVFLLNEGAVSSSNEIRHIALETRNELLKIHGDLASRMTSGFESLGERFLTSKEELTSKMEELQSDQYNATRESEINILAGQQDLDQSLTRLVGNITEAMRKNEDIATENMRTLFSEHISATDALLNMVGEGRDKRMLAKLELLSRGIHNAEIYLRDPSNPEDNKKHQQATFQIKFEVEFDFRSELISFHVRVHSF